MNSDRPWKNLGELLDLYGIDGSRGGGKMLADLIAITRLLRGTGYDARSYAAWYRRWAKISPMVHCSLMKRAAWQLLDASDDELAEMGLQPHRRNVYDLADAVSAACETEPDAGDLAARDELIRRFKLAGITPRDPEAGT